VSGYTPIFDSLTRGTLCGKWPDIGLWGVLLSMADFRGEIDATHQYIATVTGLPVSEVMACLRRFCEPDPGSRSRVAEGARLMLIDPARDWGWKVINIQAYRDKASGMNQVADGRNAEKVMRYKERHRQTPADTAGHRQTPADTAGHSQTPIETPTHTHTHTHTKKKTVRGLAKLKKCPPDFLPDLAFALSEIPDVDAKREAEKFKDWEFKTPRSDWAACWRTWIRTARDRGQYSKMNGVIWR
jgi:hypothetical protein